MPEERPKESTTTVVLTALAILLLTSPITDWYEGKSLPILRTMVLRLACRPVLNACLLPFEANDQQLQSLISACDPSMAVVCVVHCDLGLSSGKPIAGSSQPAEKENARTQTIQGRTRTGILADAHG